MAKLLHVLWVISIALALARVSDCAQKQAGAARREDVPYIKCQVCQKLASQLYHQVEKKHAQVAPKKISEYEVIEIAENVCNLKKAEADWILKIDIVERGDWLELVEQDSEGQCNSECKTIERACQEIMGYSDTDVAEYLYTNKPKLESLSNFLCKDLTKACNKKPSPLPKDRTPGEAFTPKSAKEVEIESIMKSMQGMPGVPGMKMYSREELMNQGFGANEDDEEEDDESDLALNLKKAMREKGTTQWTWKEKAIAGIKDTMGTLKRHASKISSKIRQWWKWKKTAYKKPKSNKEEL
uniref:Saposin B-type domain-containing protein n=1 Tax=Kalanchoe fedtschenkoi TaxID=63787 RepID=A0A7N0UYI9_KALFE